MNGILFDEQSKNIVRIINKEEDEKMYNKILEYAEEGIVDLIKPSTKNEVWEVLYNQDKTKNIPSLEEIEAGDFAGIISDIKQSRLGQDRDREKFYNKLVGTFGSCNLFRKFFNETASPEESRAVFVEYRKNINKLLTDCSELKKELYSITREYNEKYRKDTFSLPYIEIRGSNENFSGFSGLVHSNEPKVASIKYSLLGELSLEFGNITISGDKEKVMPAIRTFIEKGTIEDNFKSGR